MTFAAPSWGELPQGRTLPHSEESERAVLGGVLLDPDCLRAVRDRLQPEDFYGERHQIIFAAMCAIDAGKAVVDLRTLQAHLEQAEQIERCGGLTYLTSLDLDLPDIGRLDTYVEIVLDRSQRRRLVQLAGGAIRDALDGGPDLAETLADVGAKIQSLQAGSGRERARRVGEVAIEVMERIEAGHDGEGLLGKIATGFAPWDEITGGLGRGHFVVIAGATGAGKSVLAGQLARGVAGGGGVSLFVSLEMPEQELTLRWLAAESDVDFKRLERGYLVGRDWNKVIHAQRQIHAAPLYVHAPAEATLAEISAEARRLAGDQGLDLLVVDLVGLVTPARGESNRQLQVDAIARGLKQLAKSLAIPVIGTSQITRPHGANADWRPTVDDLRESKAVGHHADLVAFVHRPELYSPAPEIQHLAEIIVRKQRSGEVGTVETLFVGPTLTFRPLQRWNGGAQPPASPNDDGTPGRRGPAPF